MSRTSLPKKERQKVLLEKLDNGPFLTDEELAELLNVSVPTIRLDRLELGIPELRERIKNVAEKNIDKVKSLHGREMVGELVDLQLGVSGISILQTTPDMAFEKTKIIRGHFIYSMAESLAIAVMDAAAALVGVANIKYKSPIYAGTRLTAKAVVRRVREKQYIVWVNIFEKDKTVESFRGKFILVSIES